MRSSTITIEATGVDGGGVQLFSGNSIPLDASAAMVAVEFPFKTQGRAILRVHSTIDQTLGDGTFAHAFVLVARRGAASVLENLGFIGVNLGNAAPQIPLKALRDWSQIIVDLDGYTSYGIAGFAAIEATGGTVTVTLTPIGE